MLRPQYVERVGKNQRSPITGEVAAYERTFWKYMRMLLSYSLISSFVIAVLIAVFSMFVLRVTLVRAEARGVIEKVCAPRAHGGDASMGVGV